MTGDGERQLWVIGGVNGAGKSTLMKNTGFEKDLTFINPDNIAREISPASPERAAMAAGREAIRRQQAMIEKGESFSVETTLTGKHVFELMEKAKGAGYKVNLIYIGLDSPEKALDRIESRVAAGEHDIPVKDVLRRYDRTLENLPRALQVVDRAFIYDNSFNRPHRLLVTLENGEYRHVAKKTPEWLKKAVPSLERVPLSGEELLKRINKEVTALSDPDTVKSIVDATLAKVSHPTPALSASAAKMVGEVVEKLKGAARDLEGLDKVVFSIRNADIHTIIASRDFAKQIVEARKVFHKMPELQLER